MPRPVKVTLFMRMKHEGKWKYVPPVWNGKRIKPYHGVLNGAEVLCLDCAYYLRYTVNGQAKLENVGTEPAVAFARYEAATLVQAESVMETLFPPENPPEPGRATILEAIETYLKRETRKRHPRSIKAKRVELLAFAKASGLTYVDQIVHDTLINYRDSIWCKYEGKLSDRTVYNKLITLVTWLKHNPLLPVKGLLQYPDDYPDKEDTVPEPYTAAEIAAMKRVATPRERLVLAFFLATGCREQEVAHLEYSDLNPQHSTVRIQPKPHFAWKPKTKAGVRSIPISKALMQDLLATQQGHKRLVFPAVGGGIEGHFLRLFQELGIRAGVTGVKLHRLRDTFATERVRKARNMSELMTVATHMGHTDLSTIKLYAQLVRDTSQEAQEAAVHMDNFGESDVPVLSQ